MTWVGASQAGSAPGLGLLPLATRYEGDKRVRPARLRFGVLAGPWQRPLHATINGKPAIIRGNELRIDELEAKVVLQLSR